MILGDHAWEDDPWDKTHNLDADGNFYYGTGAISTVARPGKTFGEEELDEVLGVHDAYELNDIYWKVLSY